MAKGGLGKGLSALISEKNLANTDEQNAVPTESREVLSVNVIKPGKFQPRTFFDEDELSELAESIKKNGIVQPVLVRKSENDNRTYEIIAGERRWRAAKMSGLAAIPVIVMDLDDKRALEIGLVENIQRQDLQILEEADGYNRLVSEFGYTQEELANVIGKSRSQITNTMRLLKLPKEIKTLLNDNQLTAGHARALLTSESPTLIAEEIIRKDLNVRQTEKLVKRYSEPVEAKKSKQKDPEISALEREVSNKLGLDININNKNESGKVTITYHSLPQLDMVLRKLEA